MAACNSETIFQLIEGELEPAREEGFKAHLKKCASCRSLFQELAPVVEAFQEMDAPVMRPGEVLAMRQRILDQTVLPEEVPVTSRSAKEAALPAPAAAQPIRHVGILGWAAIFLFGLIALMIGFLGGLTAATRIDDAVASEVQVPHRILTARANPSVPALAVLPAESEPGILDAENVRIERELPSGARLIWHTRNSADETLF